MDAKDDVIALAGVFDTYGLSESTYSEVL
jgi:hypothetical protein